MYITIVPESRWCVLELFSWAFFVSSILLITAITFLFHSDKKDHLQRTSLRGDIIKEVCIRNGRMSSCRRPSWLYENHLGHHNNHCRLRWPLSRALNKAHNRTCLSSLQSQRTFAFFLFLSKARKEKCVIKMINTIALIVIKHPAAGVFLFFVYFFFILFNFFCAWSWKKSLQHFFSLWASQIRFFFSLRRVFRVSVELINFS